MSAGSGELFSMAEMTSALKPWSMYTTFCLWAKADLHVCQR